MSVFDDWNTNSNDLSRLLNEKRKKIIDNYNADKDREKLKEEIIAEVMRRIQI